MMGGERISAIKAYRVLTGAGLKESKEAVEQYWTHKGHPVVLNAAPDIATLGDILRNKTND